MEVVHHFTRDNSNGPEPVLVVDCQARNGSLKTDGNEVVSVLQDSRATAFDAV